MYVRIVYMWYTSVRTCIYRVPACVRSVCICVCGVHVYMRSACVSALHMHACLCVWFWFVSLCCLYCAVLFVFLSVSLCHTFSARTTLANAITNYQRNLIYLFVVMIAMIAFCFDRSNRYSFLHPIGTHVQMRVKPCVTMVITIIVVSFPSLICGGESGTCLIPMRCFCLSPCIYVCMYVCI